MVASLGMRVGARSKAAVPSIQLKNPGASAIPWFAGFGIWFGESAQILIEEYLDGSYAEVLPDSQTGVLPTVHGVWQVTIGWRVQMDNEPEGVPNVLAHGTSVGGHTFTDLQETLTFSGGDGQYVSDDQVTGAFRCGYNGVLGVGLGSSVGSGHHAWVAGHLITELEPVIPT